MFSSAEYPVCKVGSWKKNETKIVAYTHNTQHKMAEYFYHYYI